MARANTATLNWVKRHDPDKPPRAIHGLQGAKVTVFARSQWSTDPPQRFTVWEKAFCGWLWRKLHVKKPANHLLVLDPPAGNISLSEAWEVSVPAIPGQAEYYFEDAEAPPNQSGVMAVSSTKTAVTFKGVHAGGQTLAALDSKGLQIKIPISASRTVQASHEIGAVVDPKVRVQLLSPWGEGEHDLRAALVEWVEAAGLIDAVMSTALEAGMEPEDPLQALEALSEGFLSAENPGWEIWLDSDEGWQERQLTVSPESPREVTVNIASPQRGKRACYALRVIDDKGYVTGCVVELEETEDELCIREGVDKLEEPGEG